MRSRIVYVGNPKHKEPWQRGRKGSLCPKAVTLERAQALLDESLCCDGVRFALLDGVAFVGRSDSAGRLWHGYPVGWMEVPRSVWMKWLKEGRLKRSDIARYGGTRRIFNRARISFRRVESFRRPLVFLLRIPLSA